MIKKQKDWEIFEEEVAEYLNGKRQPGSGNGPIKKGDIRCDDFLVECKYTSKETYRLHANTWEKICDEARNIAKIPLFACRSQAGDFFIGSTLDFDNETDTVYESKSSVVVKEPFEMMLEGKMCDHSIVCWKVDLSEEE